MKLLNSKVFFILMLLVIISSTSYVSIITVGGFFLIFGATYVYIGNIFYSVITYALADVCWLYNAYEHGDMFGAVSVTFGIIVGLLVTNKMRLGKFRKSIRKDFGEVYEAEKAN